MKLQIGGSPCTRWSIARTKDRETEPEGQGWELFDNYLIALDKFKPDYFLYENNKSMSAAIRAQITKELGVEPIMINSALVSAQNRERLYWTNIPGVEQPADRGILLRDVLELGVCWREKAYTLRASIGAHGGASSVLKTIKEPGKFAFNGVAEPVRIGTIENAAKTGQYAVPCDCDVVITENSIRCQRRDKKKSTVQGSHVNFEEGKSQTLSVAHTPRVITAWDGKSYPVYEVLDGQITIKGERYPIKLADGYYIIRKLTVTECKRLQTVPDSYIFPVSNSQTYKMLGNGWTVDVIAHILSYCPGITEEPLEVLSMYDGMSCGHIALDKLGARVAAYWSTEIDKYAIKTTQANYPDTVQLGDAFQVREDGWEPWNEEVDP